MKCIRKGFSKCINCDSRFVVNVTSAFNEELFFCFATYDEARECFIDCDTLGFTHGEYVIKGTAVTLLPENYKKAGEKQ